MEFENNFYVLVTEKESGRGAMELLVDPLSGAVFAEPGPNHMWNSKYGMRMHTSTTAGENSISLQDAQTKAQTALDKEVTGASVNADGTSFYGYYTFDYSVDGKVAGMLSVNGKTGQVWLHTWHGNFVSEKSIE